MCGDFDIDLLKHETHNNNKQFIDTMYSLGLYPLIDKPTRISDSSTTLIDNIFTNELRFNLTSGILFNDISDHLPIFALCEYNISRYNVKEFQIIRKINEETMASFSNELSQQKWEDVLKTDDVNQAYDSFLHIFMDIFDKKEDVEYIAKSVSSQEISENDYNLSVSSYVEAKDTREKIDIVELNREIKTTVEKVDRLRSEIDKIVDEIEL